MNLCDTATKGLFFSVCLFFLLTITGKNVKLKVCSVLNGTFITFLEGSHH